MFAFNKPSSRAEQPCLKRDGSHGSAGLGPPGGSSMGSHHPAPLLPHLSWMAGTPFPARSPCFLAWGSLCLPPHCAPCPPSPGLLSGPLQTALGSICSCFSHAPFVPRWKDGPSAKLRSSPRLPISGGWRGQQDQASSHTCTGVNLGLPTMAGGQTIAPGITDTSPGSAKLLQTMEENTAVSLWGRCH